MKKKVALLCAVAAMGIAAAAGVSLQNRTQLSDVALANIEALASGEEGIIVGSTCMHHPDFWCVYPPMYGDPGMVLDGQIQYQGEDGAFTIPK